MRHSGLLKCISIRRRAQHMSDALTMCSGRYVQWWRKRHTFCPHGQATICRLRMFAKRRPAKNTIKCQTHKTSYKRFLNYLYLMQIIEMAFTCRISLTAIIGNRLDAQPQWFLCGTAMLACEYTFVHVFVGLIWEYGRNHRTSTIISNHVNDSRFR